MSEQKERYKIIVMAILIGTCCFLTYYFHAVLETGRVFSRFFYIPIILAALWWRRKGLVVAIFLAGLIIFSHIFVRTEVVTANDYLRALMFIVIAFVVVTLSEQIAKSHKEIKREKNFSANIITTVPESLIVVDNDLRIKKANLSFYKVFGLKPEKVIGTRITDILGDENEKHTTELTKLLGTEDMLENFELPYQSEKFGERIFNITARGMLITAEEELVVLEDITERKRAEEALRRFSEELELKVDERTKELRKAKGFSENIVTTVPDSLLVLDANLRIKSANRSFYEKFQTEPDEVIGTGIADILGDNDGKLGTKLTKLLGTEDMLENFELHYQSEKLGERIFNITARGMLIAEEEEEEELVVLEDISERKRTEKEVKQSRKFLDTIIENIPDPLYIKDRQFRFVEVNKAFCRTRKVTRGEMLGKTRYRETDEEIFKTGKELEIPEQYYTDAEGNQHWTYLKKVPLTDESGEITHVLTISRDITNQKAMEDALHAAYNELKTRDKQKTDFLNVTYHDLRSPLAPIIGYASLLEQSKLSEKQKNYVNIIEKSSRQLEEMVDRMLEATRIETGKVELALEPVSIPEIVNDALERIKPQVDAKKQTISTAVPEGIEIEGDKQKITAIFDNLILNAIKYTDEKGRIDIVVEDRNEEEDIRVCVADTGVGISGEHLPRVFERFYMVDTSLTRKGGLGLGLAIVKRYVEQHGGEVWVTSEPGKGAKFWFTLPKKQKQR